MSTLTSMQKLENKRKKIVLMNDGSIKPFDQVNIYVKTAVVLTNIRIDTEKYFELVPITYYEPPVKRRGRKRNGMPEPEPVQLEVGSCVFVQKRRETRGTPIKKRKDKDKHFLHCVTGVFALPNQIYATIKIPTNGKLHITGCKTNEQYVLALQMLLKSFDDIEAMTGQRVYTLHNDYKTSHENEHRSTDSIVQAVINIVMVNRDFNIGFLVSRENLDNFINTSELDWASTFESAMHTSAQIKIPNNSYRNIKLQEVQYDMRNRQVISSVMRSFDNFASYFEDKNKKKDTRDKYYTFGVFANGSVIMSGRGDEMESVYQAFVSLLIENRASIEQVVDDIEPLVKISNKRKRNHTSDSESDEEAVEEVEEEEYE